MSDDLKRRKSIYSVACEKGIPGMNAHLGLALFLGALAFSGTRRCLLLEH
jgi:hypothetical protein